jgi:hypothetical protein
MVVAGLVSNYNNKYMNHMSFYMILVSIPPHLPPHRWCAGANYRSINQKIFQTELGHFCGLERLH